MLKFNSSWNLSLSLVLYLSSSFSWPRKSNPHHCSFHKLATHGSPRRGSNHRCEIKLEAEAGTRSTRRLRASSCPRRKWQRYRFTRQRHIWLRVLKIKNKTKCVRTILCTLWLTIPGVYMLNIYFCVKLYIVRHAALSPQTFFSQLSKTKSFLREGRRFGSSPSLPPLPPSFSLPVFLFLYFCIFFFFKLKKEKWHCNCFWYLLFTTYRIKKFINYRIIYLLKDLPKSIMHALYTQVKSDRWSLHVITQITFLPLHDTVSGRA